MLVEQQLEAVVRAGLFRDRQHALQEALQTLFAARPQLRTEAAVELFRTGEVSLLRAAEMAGLDGESFRRLLRERAIPWETDAATNIERNAGLPARDLSPNLPETVVARAHRLNAAGHTNAALDLIYDAVDKMMRQGEWDRLNTLLANITVADLSIDILLGVLTATLPAKSRLPARPKLFQEIAQILQSRGEYEEGLLTGLEE